MTNNLSKKITVNKSKFDSLGISKLSRLIKIAAQNITTKTTLRRYFVALDIVQRCPGG